MITEIGQGFLADTDSWFEQTTKKFGKMNMW